MRSRKPSELAVPSISQGFFQLALLQRAYPIFRTMSEFLERDQQLSKNKEEEEESREEGTALPV
jgi:hypothetical protein